ncbi:MAG: LemA family protein [Clostridia bacterium]|nr:LemA family protein [Clostridia bacterium]
MSIAVIIVLVIVFLLIMKYNSMIKAKKEVIQARSGIDVYLQQRFDLIPNLIEVVKGYMHHEQEIFEKITMLRAQYLNQKDLKVSTEIENNLNNIIAIAERYPELKSSEQFLNLQKSLSKIESQIQASRRIYNMAVTNYNTKINTFPNNIFAHIFDFREEELFKITDTTIKENINVNL